MLINLSLESLEKSNLISDDMLIEIIKWEKEIEIVINISDEERNNFISKNLEKATKIINIISMNFSKKIEDKNLEKFNSKTIITYPFKSNRWRKPKNQI